MAADSTLSATSLAFLKNLIRYIKAIERSIKNTVKVALTMISKASAAVSIILIINSKTIFNKRKNIIRKVARVTDLFRTRRDRKPEGVSYKAERERSRLYIKLFFNKFLCQAGVGLTFGFGHHLANQETDGFGLAGFDISDYFGIFADDFGHDFFDF